MEECGFDDLRGRRGFLGFLYFGPDGAPNGGDWMEESAISMEDRQVN